MPLGAIGIAPGALLMFTDEGSLRTTEADWALDTMWRLYFCYYCA